MEAFIRSDAQAYDLILGDAGKVFDLSQESPETRDRYGRNTFGQSCLVARRLVERSVQRRCDVAHARIARVPPQVGLNMAEGAAQAHRGDAGGEQRPDRFGLRFLAAGSPRFACRFLGDDGETFLLGSFGMENAFRRNGYGHQNEDRTQQGTHTHVHIWIHLQTLP